MAVSLVTLGDRGRGRRAYGGGRGLSVAQMQPGQALLREYVPRWLKSRGLVKCANMEMRFGRQPLAFAGQCRPALGAKSAPRPRRGVELGYLAFGNSIIGPLECREDRDGCTAMLATTLAVAPRHPFRLTHGHKAYRATDAATL